MTPSLQSWFAAGTRFDFRGHEVFLRRGGSGPPLLLIHGYPLGSWDWHRIWDALEPHHQLIAADMLGMGFSAKPRDGGYRIADHADLHQALLDELRIERVHLLAHDLGVSIAQELLARQAEGRLSTTIGSVVFLNGGLFSECYRPRLIQRLLGSPLGSWLGPRIPRSAFERTIRGLFGPDTQPSTDDLESMWQLVDSNYGRQVTHLVGRFVFDRREFRDRLVASLLDPTVPMRLINGSLDPNSGAHMVARYRELVPNPDVVELPTIGHWPQLEAPGAVAAAALEHFEKAANR